MDPKQMTKQMIDFHKSAFDNTFSALMVFQEQGEKMFSMFLEQSPWFPEEGKKAIKEWSKNFKKGRDEFKASVDEGYKKIETFVTGMDKAKTK